MCFNMFSLNFNYSSILFYHLSNLDLKYIYGYGGPYGRQSDITKMHYE